MCHKHLKSIKRFTNSEDILYRLHTHYLAWEVIIELWLGSAGVGGPHEEKRLGTLNSQKILRVPSS